MLKLFLHISLLFCICLTAQNKSFETLSKDFVKCRDKLSIPQMVLDYKTNFANIKSNDELEKQASFFDEFTERLSSFPKTDLTLHELIRLSQLTYECSINLERIELEKKWNTSTKIIPDGGLYTLDNHSEWYSYLVKYFTSVDITPEKVYEYGESEVKKIQTQISEFKTLLGFPNDESFYGYLKKDTFFISNKDLILRKYASIDSTVRKNYTKLFKTQTIPELSVMEWPNAGPTTPPGIYLNNQDNLFGKDVFQYNFYGSKHNARSMEWLYMHEAIPGHHFQFSVKNNLKNEALKNQIFYFGNAEGWACYIENFGEEMGLYKNPYSYLGKLEWDLVRSARLVMEVGIHYYGWKYDDAMKYWKKNIKGQDAIASREINRITNWAAQSLCYKIGAKVIEEIVNQHTQSGIDIKSAHQFILEHGDVPLQSLLMCSRNQK